ncbi:hypothetical protein QR680_017090 [Steinernema hermaphroditum]|uniref:C6 domain-containing protein n=1 Tax=Steinernema hermaphroditum TaxID=289476 RepID=A0AA39HE93_9BILA|nr:hypothetical protein QR680_017090 [Steinernema hermaphroditum]
MFPLLLFLLATSLQKSLCCLATRPAELPGMVETTSRTTSTQRNCDMCGDTVMVSQDDQNHKEFEIDEIDVDAEGCLRRLLGCRAPNARSVALQFNMREAAFLFGPRSDHVEVALLCRNGDWVVEENEAPIRQVVCSVVTEEENTTIVTTSTTTTTTSTTTTTAATTLTTTTLFSNNRYYAFNDDHRHHHNYNNNGHDYIHHHHSCANDIHFHEHRDDSDDDHRHHDDLNNDNFCNHRNSDHNKHHIDHEHHNDDDDRRKANLNKAIEVDDTMQGADGCLLRTFGCFGVEDPTDTNLVWNDGAAGTTSSLDGTAEYVEERLSCSDEAKWILTSRQSGMTFVVTSVYCLSLHFSECEKCVESIRKIIELPLRKEIETDETTKGSDGCLQRRIGCQGLPNPTQTSLEWNMGDAGFTFGELGVVEVELGCNERAEWILTMEDVKIPITAVSCIAA